MLVLKLVQVADAPLIALVARVSFSETFGKLFADGADLSTYLDQTFNVAKIRAGIQKPHNLFVIAYWDELPVGYGKLKLDSTSEFVAAQSICQIQKLYVLKDFLSQKIGLALHTYLLQKAREKGYQQVWLSVLASNRRAIRFYEKDGFAEIGKFPFQIGKENFDFLAMHKNV